MTDPGAAPHVDETGPGVQPLPLFGLAAITVRRCFYCHRVLDPDEPYHPECYADQDEDDRRNFEDAERECLG